MVFAIYTSFTPLHDATHRAVSSNKFLNDLLGTISGSLLIPFSTAGIYRYLHLSHHRCLRVSKLQVHSQETFGNVQQQPWSIARIDSDHNQVLFVRDNNLGGRSSESNRSRHSTMAALGWSNPMVTAEAEKLSILTADVVVVSGRSIDGVFFRLVVPKFNSRWDAGGCFLRPLIPRLFTCRSQ